ncbi:thioredoxin domain-containing protein [Geminicoccaceae bacterium 1502E]|nr:thioredoxin domain-containing protein [Geminicoccaceae bacterium 1502E]
MSNELAKATSPYLLQHKDNPVHWREWNEETLAEARASDRPILLSVGYAACHWCHVMAHECFESPEIAAVMNAHFVNIKVDREERPDLDSIYQQALALLGQQGGWPLTMFLTPDGAPVWGGTYFPPEPRHGRPGLPQVLEQIARLWAGERHKLDGNREQLGAALARLARPEPGAAPTPAAALRTALALGEELDAVHGGIGGAPKFPQSPVLAFLWEAALAPDGDLLRRRLLHTLARICQGGIYDHLGGGFARYSVDAYWLAPHFEKMLYDNAQLLALLARAWNATGEELFRQRAIETVGWLEREMMVGEVFASSLDADSEGEEGRFYVWDAAEIDGLLGPDAALFKHAYGVTARGNWEGKSILNRLHEPGLPPAAEAQRLAGARARLLEAREKRVRPGLDDKVLADWNGLMIAALAEAGLRFGLEAWVERARTAFDGILARMSDGDRLHHSWREGQSLKLAFLDDYAQMATAALMLLEATGEERFLHQAVRWIDIADADFADGGGGYYLAPVQSPPLPVRPRNAHDGPSPSAAGTLAQASVKLWCLTGEDRHRARAEAILGAFGGEMLRNPFAHATLLDAALFAASPLQLVLVGDPGDAAFKALREVAVRDPRASRVLLAVRDPARLPASHPAHGKAAIGDRPTAWLCTGTTCLAPALEPGDLAARFREAASRPAA